MAHLLANPIYCGLQVQHTKQTTDINRDIVDDIDEDEWIIHYRPELAYVDFDLYNRVQLERTNRHPNCIKYKQVKIVDDEPRLVVLEVKRNKSELLPSTRHSNKHLFSNVLYCGNCGWAHSRRLKKEGRQPYHYWCCSRNHKYGKTECAYTNRYRETELLEIVKSELEEFRSNHADRQWYLEAYIRTKFPQTENEESILAELDADLKKVTVRIEANFELWAEKEISKEEFKERKDRLNTQKEELQQKQNAIRQRDQEIHNLKIKFDETMKSLATVDFNALTNSELRRIVDRIDIYTNPRKLATGKKKDAMQVNIHWKFLDKSTEGEVFWDHAQVEHDEWKRNVWYEGMTDEEIREREEWEEMRREWEQSPEGQQYLREQDELSREIFEAEKARETIEQ